VNTTDECGEDESTDDADVLSIFLYPESSFEVMAFLVAGMIRGDQQCRMGSTQDADRSSTAYWHRSRGIGLAGMSLHRSCTYSIHTQRESSVYP